METFYQYSGVLTVLSSLFLVVLPSFYLKRNKKIEVISDTGTLGGLGIVVDLGMLVSGLMLLVFILKVLTSYPSVSEISVFVLSVSAVSLSLGGLISKRVYSNLHRVFIYIFFITSYIGGLMFNFVFLEVEVTFLLLQLIILTGGIGTALIYKHREMMKAQVWGVLFADLWVVLIYLFLL